MSIPFTKKIHLTLEQCRLTRIAINEQIQLWKEHNLVIQMHGTDEQIEQLVNRNNQHIAELENILTLL
jgi:hypothetical protein